MPAGQSTWQIKGAAGSLKTGGRLAAQISGWEAKPDGEGGWRVTATTTEVDAYWLENGTRFRAALTMGKGELRGVATLISLEPLTFDLEEAR